MIERLNRYDVGSANRFNVLTRLTIQRTSGFGFGLAQAGDAVARLPLAVFLEQFRALKALEHIPFAAQFGGRAQTPML